MSFPGLGSWIERHAVRSPDRAALRAGGTDRTYVQFAAEVRSTAASLIERGIGVGDRVAYHGQNHPAALSSLFATASIGAIWVPIHPTRAEDEVLRVLDDCSPSVVVRAWPERPPASGVPVIDVEELQIDPDAPRVDREVQPDELTVLAYTSGTTGDPKGVMLSQANILWNVVQMLTACAFSPTDVTLAAAPLTRMGGLGVTVLPTLFAGGMVVVPPTTDGSAVLRSIEHDRVTVLFANPHLLEEMVRAPAWAASDLGSIRTGVVGGGLVPEPLLRAYLDRGVRLRHGYGLTEGAPVVSLLDDDEAADRPTSVGRPLPFVDVRAVRPDGSECDVDEIGEWTIRGPNVFGGYWGRPPVVDDEGWFATGDVGSIDRDGYLTFIDRLSSGIHIGGAIAYPATVETRLYGVRGLSDGTVGEVDGRLVVAIVEEPGEQVDDGLVLVAAKASLPPSMPEPEIRRLPSIPRNAAGKVRRDELRAMLR